MASGNAVKIEEAQWLLQWKSAAAALDEHRAGELRRMTAAEAWAAIEAVLTFPVSTPLPEERQVHSGLVDMQQHFKKLRSK